MSRNPPTPPACTEAMTHDPRRCDVAARGVGAGPSLAKYFPKYHALTQKPYCTRHTVGHTAHV
eukprot:2212068-Prymnesium_polylepis.1